MKSITYGVTNMNNRTKAKLHLTSELIVAAHKKADRRPKVVNRILTPLSVKRALENDAHVNVRAAAILAAREINNVPTKFLAPGKA